MCVTCGLLFLSNAFSVNLQPFLLSCVSNFRVFTTNTTQHCTICCQLSCFLLKALWFENSVFFFFFFAPPTGLLKLY